ncbi:MAG: hypothetical protein RMN25_05375 [Anaerolineae bacterium]|nr:hypothetical protein [Thermoflexales bacterium]MDW8407197.1 hypothetical protein [Anaerolineae bacterium]
MEEHHPAQSSPESSESYKPQAVLIFLAIMLIGYIVYWAYVWFVTLQRAGG